MFVASVFNSLSASGSEQLAALLSSLGPSLAVHRFKVALCQKFFATAGNDSHSQADERWKVQARAQPRACRPERNATAPDVIPTSASRAQSNNKLPLPECSEICRLLEMKFAALSPSSITPSLMLRLKFELINSYGALQLEAWGSEKDQNWLGNLRDGRLLKTLSLAFDGEEGKMYLDLLESITSTWWRHMSDG
jgi:hypothetical protein